MLIGCGLLRGVLGGLALGLFELLLHLLKGDGVVLLLLMVDMGNSLFVEIDDL